MGERTVPKIPFSISVYEHAARLIGRSPWEVSRDPELLYQAHRAAYLLYRHFPVVVGIDIYNLEAEASGCVVKRPEGNGIPAVTRPRFGSLDDALAWGTAGRAPTPVTAGRIPAFVAAGRRLAAEFPEADVRLPVSGPFSIATSLLGLEALLVGVAERPEVVRALLIRLIPGQLAFCRAVREAGLEVAFFESAAAPPLLSPRQFREVELPALQETMQGVAEIVGHSVPCIIGGDTEPIVDALMETGTDFVICPAETNRERFLARMRRYPHVKVRVNLNPALYTRGTREEIITEVDRVIALAGGKPNVLLGTGAVPYETPPENLLLIRDYVA